MVDTSSEKSPSEKSKESSFIHNWDEPPKTIFSVDACWHGSDGIGRVQCFITDKLSKVMDYIKSRIGEDFKKDIWWEVVGREVGSRSTESSYFAQIDILGTPMKSTPTKASRQIADTHIASCSGCKWKYLQKLAEYMKYDKSHKDEAYYSDYILSIMNTTGRIFDNGIEVFIESHRRTFYVKDDGTVSFRPIGAPLPSEDPEKHL